MQPPANNVGIGYETLDQAQPQQAQPAPSGNWLTHLLPTGGALAGGAGGAALGTMILPGIGTIAGGILGAALGGGESKAVENGVEHQALGNGVAGSAIEGGVGQALGGVAGKVLGKGAELIGNRAAGLVGKDAAQDAIDSRALALKDISPQDQIKYNANDSLDHVQNMGFDSTDPAQVQQVSQNTNDYLNSHLDKALADSGTIDLSHYPQLIKNALADQSDVLGSYEPVGVRKGQLGLPKTQAGNLLSAMENLGMGKATTESDPNVIRTLTTKLGNMAQKYKGSDLPENKAAYDAIHAVRGEVKNALYNRPEVNTNLAKTVANAQAGDVGSQQLADHLNNVISTAGASGKMPSQDILSEISRNIDIDNLGNRMAGVRQIGSSTAGQARAAADAGISNNNTNAVLDAGKATHSILNGGGGPLGIAGRAVLHTKDNPALLNTLSRMGKLTAKIAPPVATAAAMAPTLAASPVPAPQQQDATMSAMTPQATQPNSYQELINAMQAQAILAPSMGGGASSFLGQVAPQLQKNQLASGELSALPASFANAGGAQGTGGILSRISGLVPGTAANTYEGQSAATAQALANALGISPQAAQALIPQLMQNQQSAGISSSILGNLQSNLAY